MPSPAEAVANRILDDLEQQLLDAGENQRPVELSPHREAIFDHFVTAWNAGLTSEDSNPNLSADGICKTIAGRWSLGDSARTAVEGQSRMSQEDMSRMRLLWSLMRLWMEWSYAWTRYPEFHTEDGVPAKG